jgi:hypothetical protein
MSILTKKYIDIIIIIIIIIIVLSLFCQAVSSEVWSSYCWYSVKSN